MRHTLSAGHVESVLRFCLPLVGAKKYGMAMDAAFSQNGGMRHIENAGHVESVLRFSLPPVGAKGHGAAIVARIR
jgi:hypothetical protein